LGGFRENELRTQLRIAGLYALSPLTFLGYRVLAAILLPAVLLWMLSIIGAPVGFVVLAAVFGLLAGWVLPMTYVRRKADQRFGRIERDLPELIDVLVLTVEAGLGFNGAMQLASGRLGGPLGDELRLTLQEQSMGLSINAALTNLLGRCDTPSMRSFVRSVLQGETLGVSMGTIMRNLAVEMRKRRRRALPDAGGVRRVRTRDWEPLRARASHASGGSHDRGRDDRHAWLRLPAPLRGLARSLVQRPPGGAPTGHRRALPLCETSRLSRRAHRLCRSRGCVGHSAECPLRRGLRPGAGHQDEARGEGARLG